MAKSRFLLTILLASLALPAARANEVTPPDKVSFYFAAHQDDWQLFMNPSAFEDVAAPNTKTVFMHVTAGDAGLGTGRSGRRFPYYLARENGAETAIRFMADAQGWPLQKTASRKKFNGHLIYRVSYRNTVAYFLRLPDGSPDGNGYKETGYQSLRRLAAANIVTLSAIDGSAVYRGWNDLVATIRSILDFERGSAPLVQLNVAESDLRRNPRDHSDHLMTAKAALDATARLSCVRRLHFVDYASSKLPPNLNSEQRDMESSVVAVTAAGILALDHGSIWQQYFQSYLGRNYFRVEEGIGRCGHPATEFAVKR
jgi:hypothetical protein